MTRICHECFFQTGSNLVVKKIEKLKVKSELWSRCEKYWKSRALGIVTTKFGSERLPPPQIRIKLLFEIEQRKR